MLLSILISIIILVFSVICHELAHGYIADLQGDHTARMSGRLSWDPRRHFDPLGSFIIPLISYNLGGIIFGWAKPVPINENNFHNGKQGTLWCALAGPLANLTIAFVAGSFLKFGASGLVADYLFAAVKINFYLALFNLMPIPPMDGSRVLAYFLSGRAAYYYYQLEQYGFVIVFALLYLGFFSWVLNLAMPLMRFFY